jgi:hypothetical protein
LSKSSESPKYFQWERDKDRNFKSAAILYKAIQNCTGTEQRKMTKVSWQHDCKSIADTGIALHYH